MSVLFSDTLELLMTLTPSSAIFKDDSECVAKISAFLDRFSRTSQTSLATLSCVMLVLGMVVMVVEGTMNLTSVALVLVTQDRQRGLHYALHRN